MAKPHKIRVLVYDGLCNFEFGMAYEVFGLPRPELAVPWYDFALVAAEPGLLRAQAGLTVEAPLGLDDLADLGASGTVVVPGWRSADAPVPEPLIEALRAAWAGGTRMLSLCSGVFVLAAAGLLDGRRATTHWRYAERLAARYPAITVAPDVLYIDEGQILTSAGSAAGLDLCLHLVRRDHGAAIANQVARRLVLPAHRDGGQAQFIERPLTHESSGLAPLLDRLRERLAEPLTVTEMAKSAGMSPRSFNRHFKAATGQSPNAWLTAERVAHSRLLLETTKLSIDRVADAAGFGSPESYRLHFKRATGIAPSLYRERFAADEESSRRRV